MNLEELKKENKELKKKILVAKLWMEREVRSHVSKIAKSKVSNMTSKTKDLFFSENVEEIITKKVSDFFGEILLLNIPSNVVENIISAEVLFFNLRENPSSDGLGVISSYHKSLDILIETYITKSFRKFANKKGQIYLRVNDPLEKALNSVVNQGYILSVGRLFHILKLIKNDGELFDYGKAFKEFLEKFDYISDILFLEEFYNNFEKLVNSEILGRKRHVGKISFEETKKAREFLIGDFKNENCLIYKLVEIGKVDY